MDPLLSSIFFLSYVCQNILLNISLEVLNLGFFMLATVYTEYCIDDSIFFINYRDLFVNYIGRLKRLVASRRRLALF